MAVFDRWFRRAGKRQPRRPIPDALWQETLTTLPWLSDRAQDELARLRDLTALFLEDKEFHGAQGLAITDAMAVHIAAQACLPVLHFGQGAEPLRWYDDFVTLVVHPDEVLAPRVVTDKTGVVHEYEEPLAGEAMAEGPVMLSWQDVSSANASEGYNVVIHEFVHKLDQRDGEVDGCPPMPPGIFGLSSARLARKYWLETLQTEFDAFRNVVIAAERFGQPEPWLDPYGSQEIAEFFAVASEGYFVNRARFAGEFPALLALFDAFYLNGATKP